VAGTVRVFEVGQPADGFTTTFPLNAALDENSGASLIVDYADAHDHRQSSTLDFMPSEVGSLGEATMSDYQCGLDPGAIVRFFAWLLAGLVAFGVALLVLTTGLLAAIRRAVKGAPLDP
jgi:hypothetical protein